MTIKFMLMKRLGVIRISDLKSTLLSLSLTMLTLFSATVWAEWLVAVTATDSVYGSSHFPEDDCPMKLPDLTLHKNALACVLKGTPSLYTEHREVVTAGGVGLVSLEYASRYSRGSFSPIRQKAHSHIHIFQRYTI